MTTRVASRSMHGTVSSRCRSSWLPLNGRVLYAFLVVQSLGQGSAFAQASSTDVQNRRAAAEAYDNGTARYLQRDFAAAANWFETADRLAPSPVALQSAIRAHREAGGIEHLARAATLALRLQSRYPNDARAQQFARRTLEALQSQLMRVTVQCGSCEIEVDSVLQSAPEFFVTPGRHTLRAHWPGGRTRERTIEASEGATQTVTFEEPPAAVAAPVSSPPATETSPTTSSPVTSVTSAGPAPARDVPPPRAGLSPVFFISGTAATLLFGALTVASWLDALEGGRQLIDEAARTHMRNLEREQSVHAAEDRTTALLITTGVVGTASLITGVFFTRWGDSRRTAVVPIIDGSHPTGLAVRVRFRWP